MDCQDARNLIIETLTGTASPDVRRALEAHLADCRACLAEAATVEETMSLLRAVPQPHPREEYWTDFMARLQRRLEADRSVWDRLRHWVRRPRHAWQTVAATSALIVVLGAALLMQPAPQVSETPSSTNTQLHAYVTDGVRQAMPAMSISLAVWKAGLGASEVTYDLTGGR